MTPNQILLLSLFQGVLVVVSLYGPYIGIGVYQLIVSCGINAVYFAVVRKIDISQTSPVNFSLRAFVDFFYLATASSVIPFAIFLYLAAETWVKSVAVLSIILCGLAYGKTSKLVEKRERAK